MSGRNDFNKTINSGQPLGWPGPALTWAAGPSFHHFPTCAHWWRRPDQPRWDQQQFPSTLASLWHASKPIESLIDLFLLFDQPVFCSFHILFRLGIVRVVVGRMLDTSCHHSQHSTKISEWTGLKCFESFYLQKQKGISIGCYLSSNLDNSTPELYRISQLAG